MLCPIEINCPPARLEQNAAIRERLEAVQRFQKTDRTPVQFSFASRYFLRERGVPEHVYFRDPRSQLEQQLLNRKWLVEHVFDDRLIDEEQITIAPDFGNIRGGYFPIKVNWEADSGPMAEPILHTPEDVEALAVPGAKDGVYAMKVEWFHAMREMATEYEVTLNGRPLAINVTIGGAGGPFPDAYALARDRIFSWVYDAPETVHLLMDKVTTAFINHQRYTRELAGTPMTGLGMGADAAEMLSPEMYREFVLPYYRRCYDAFPGRRGLHMCGRIDHLLPLLAEEMEITHLNGFGSPTNPALLAEVMGGKVVMSGGIDPVLLLCATREEIKRQCFYYINMFTSRGGYILQDGNNVAPGTSLSNLSAVVEAAEEFGQGR